MYTIYVYNTNTGDFYEVDEVFDTYLEAQEYADANILLSRGEEIEIVEV